MGMLPSTTGPPSHRVLATHHRHCQRFSNVVFGRILPSHAAVADIVFEQASLLYSAATPTCSRRNLVSRALSNGDAEANLHADVPIPARLSSDPPATTSRQESPVLVKVRFSVHYRVHSRQMLFVGGSEMPFGWSFLSIARVPMIWSPGDIWTAEVELRAGTKMEYKYVILEEQDWTKQENIDAEGEVTFSYRTEPDDPPDYQTIQKKMAIVAWQPGPNRTIQVPNVEELSSVKPGEVRARALPRIKRRDQVPPQWPFAPVQASNSIATNAKPDAVSSSVEWEALSVGEEGSPLLERRDQWGFSDRNPPRIRLSFGP